MARIAGVNVPTNKRLIIALTYIYGIGPKYSKDICEKVKIDGSKRVNNLNEDEIINLMNSNSLIENRAHKVFLSFFLLPLNATLRSLSMHFSNSKSNLKFWGKGLNATNEE